MRGRFAQRACAGRPRGGHTGIRGQNQRASTHTRTHARTLASCGDSADHAAGEKATVTSDETSTVSAAKASCSSATCRATPTIGAVAAASPPAAASLPAAALSAAGTAYAEGGSATITAAEHCVPGVTGPA